LPFSEVAPYLVVAAPTRASNIASVACKYPLMKNRTFVSLFVLVALTVSLQAGPAEEKAFTDKYKAAFEGKDMPTLESLLYTEGADPTIVGFFKMMLSGEAGAKISKIDLVDLTPEEAQKAAGAQPSPDGGKVCLPLKATKKLVVEINASDSNGSSKSTETNFVAEKDGKLVIPVPGPCK
jgi:hypothetical protein